SLAPCFRDIRRQIITAGAGLAATAGGNLYGALSSSSAANRLRVAADPHGAILEPLAASLTLEWAGAPGLAIPIITRRTAGAAGCRDRGDARVDRAAFRGGNRGGAGRGVVRRRAILGPSGGAQARARRRR